MSAFTAPQTHSQPSRKTRRAWRKNIDLNDLSKSLDNAREEKIITGNQGLLADQPASSLFQKDVTGDVAIKKQTRKQYGRLRADEILAQRSAVPAVSTRKRTASVVTDGLIPDKRRKRGGVSHKEYQRLRQVAYGGDNAHKDVIPASESANYDPWEATAPIAVAADRDFLEPPKPIRAPDTLKRAPTSLRADGRVQASVTKPHAGRSYNPEFEDWTELLSQEGQTEIAKEGRRQNEAAKEAERLERVAKATKEAEKENNENSTGDYESEWEGIQSEVDESELQVKRPRRKTQPERNRIKRRKEAERLVKHEAKMKQRDEQARQIKQIKAEVDAKEVERNQNLQLTERSSDAVDQDEVDMKLRRRNFGKHAIPEQPLELILPDELQDSLRKLRPEGNLLNDRFRTLMVQGKIETRRPAIPKKARTTVTEKWSHKDWKLK